MKTRTSFLIVCCIAATALAARPEGGEQENTTPPTEQQIHRTSDEKRSLKHLMLGGTLLNSLERSPERRALMWREFALDVGLSDADLAAFRAELPEAGVDDLAWIREVQNMGGMWLEAVWPLDAHDLLFSMPEMQVLLKQWADAYYGKPILGPSDPADLEAELWRRFEPQIGSFADMKARKGDGLFTAADVLWVHTAKEYDAAMLLDGSVTAAQLLTMPDYQLQRKLFVDSHVSALVDCVRCALNPTPACGAEHCENTYSSTVNQP